MTASGSFVQRSEQDRPGEIFSSETNTTADRTGSELDVPNYSGALIKLNLASILNSPTYKPRIQWKDPQTSSWFDLFTGSGVSSAGDFLYMVGDGVGNSTSSELTDSEQLMLPRKIRFEIVASTADASNNADTKMSAVFING